ncbi:MAG: ABC transporter permease [Acidobacteriia bacterium]|nr:ABC transporter permease [Terriglobia bacterium]
MRKLWLVAKREYLVRVRTRAFLISTVSLPLITLAILFLSLALARSPQDHPLKIALLDDAGELAGSVAKRLSGKLPDGRPAFDVTRTINQPGQPAKARDELRAELRRGQLDAYLVIPHDVLQGKAGEFYAKDPGDGAVTAPLRRALTEAVVARRLEQSGVHVDDLPKLLRSVDLTLVRVTGQGEAEEKGQTYLLAMALATVLYVTLLTYGIATMRSILEEKATRIVEILVASIRPSQLLAGKIVGVAGVGLTQFLIWVLTAAALGAYGSAITKAVQPQARPVQFHLPLSLLGYLVVFFLGGYLLYAALYAAVGAVVSSEEDAQQMQWPVTFLVILAFVPFGTILHDPNSPAAIVLSLIPFFTPILMFLRIALEPPPFWQIALSIGLLALAIFGLIRFAGKVYRVGVLMYGKRPSLIEIFRWMKYS